MKLIIEAAKVAFREIWDSIMDGISGDIATEKMMTSIVMNCMT